MPQAGHAAWLAADAEDRRTAIQVAAVSGGTWHTVIEHAQAAYVWLRSRPTLRVTAITLTPGTPHPEGTPMATVFDLSDTDEVSFTLTGLDAKGASVPLPDGSTATWALADPDATGAVLTPSADTASAVLSAGVPDSSLMVSVSVEVTNADGSTATLTGAEAVVVQATAAQTVGIVAGTPTPETPAGN